MELLSPLPFYTEWKGHTISDLQKLFANSLLTRGDKPIVWLAGDSSLDNKAWIPADGRGGTPLPVSIPDIYTLCFKKLTPMKPDVAYWMNHHLGERATVINAAVEASLLRERSHGQLLAHDRFIRNNIRPQDILVVSVGANDIALSPTVCTAFNMLLLAHVSNGEAIENGSAWPLSHFKKMFKRDVQKYITNLVKETKPAAVILCMIYYPLESRHFSEPGWADAQLKALKYDSQPGKLQAAIRSIYEQATKNVKVEETTIIPLPLYEVLDGKTAAHYVERVEPSVEGGKKMSEMITKQIVPMLGEDGGIRHDSHQSANGTTSLT